MSLEELYRQVILDHYRNPRRRGVLAGDPIHAEGQNPSCGDEFSLDLKVENDVVTDVALQGIGCSNSQASGSTLAEALMGKSIGEVAEMADLFKAMMGITEGDNPVNPDRPGSVLGDLEALQGVRKFPVRVKCADLPWTTLENALESVGAATG